MFFNIFRKKVKIQHEYVELIRKIIESPLWDGSDEQIIACLPTDLTIDTIHYVREQTQQKLTESNEKRRI